MCLWAQRLMTKRWFVNKKFRGGNNIDITYQNVVPLMVYYMIDSLIGAPLFVQYYMIDSLSGAPMLIQYYMIT